MSDEAWAAAPAIAKQAAVSASLETIDAYAKAASEAGGFDDGDAHLTRASMHLDARGFEDVSQACLRILAQLDRIEEAATERIALNPHTGETKDVALVMMLFEAARGGPAVLRRPSSALSWRSRFASAPLEMASGSHTPSMAAGRRSCGRRPG